MVWVRALAARMVSALSVCAPACVPLRSGAWIGRRRRIAPLGGVELVEELAESRRHAAHAIHEAGIGGELVDVAADGIPAFGELAGSGSENNFRFWMNRFGWP